MKAEPSGNAAEGATMVQIGEVRTFEELADAMERLNDIGDGLTPQQALEVTKTIRQRACDLVCGANNEENKRNIVAMLTLIIDIAEAELAKERA